MIITMSKILYSLGYFNIVTINICGLNKITSMRYISNLMYITIIFDLIPFSERTSRTKVSQINTAISAVHYYRVSCTFSAKIFTCDQQNENGLSTAFANNAVCSLVVVAHGRRTL